MVEFGAPITITGDNNENNGIEIRSGINSVVTLNVSDQNELIISDKNGTYTTTNMLANSGGTSKIYVDTRDNFIYQSAVTYSAPKNNQYSIQYNGGSGQLAGSSVFTFQSNTLSTPSIAVGETTLASGTDAIATGKLTKASGSYSFAGGYGAPISMPFTPVELYVTAAGNNSINFGIISGTYSGSGVTGNNSYAFGSDSKIYASASGIYSVNTGTINVNGAVSAMIGGQNHTINSGLSFIGGGNGNACNNLMSAVVGGLSNIVNHQGSVILGGASQTSVANNTVYCPELETTTAGNGVILKAVGGNRFRLSVDATGGTFTTAV